MKIFKKIMKLPLTLLSAVLILAGIVMLIVMGVKDYTKGTYKGEVKLGSFKLADIQVKIIDKDTYETTSNFLGEAVTESYQYKLRDGYVYTYDEEYEEHIVDGKISAYKFKGISDGEVVMVLKCKKAYTIRNTAIVLISLGVVFALTSVGFFTYDAIKNQKATEEKADKESSAE